MVLLASHLQLMIPVKKKRLIKAKLLSLYTWLACNVGNKKTIFSLAFKNTSFIVFQSTHMKLLVVWTGMSLRASLRLISPAEKDLITCSNCLRKQRHGITLKMYLSKKASLTNKKAWGFKACSRLIIHTCTLEWKLNWFIWFAIFTPRSIAKIS